MKKISLLLSMVLLFTCLGTNINADEFSVPISIFVNEQLVTTDSEPVIINATTFVPIRQISEAFMVDEIIWNNDEKSVEINLGDTYIKFYINESVAYINNEAYTLTSPPIILNRRSMVPIRFIAEALDCEVSWDNNTHSVIVTKEMETEMVYASEDGYSYSNEDILWLSRIVHVEAYDLSYEGKLAIANVILNRRDSSLFPNTVYGVIFDNNYTIQFPPAYKSSFTEIQPMDGAVTAAKIALGGENNIDTCLYFNNSPFSWKSEDDLYKVIEGEYFYY